jgi:cell division protein FtsB
MKANKIRVGAKASQRKEIIMTNLNCCHLALVLALANIITLAIFAGYTVKLRERTLLLEKKNGKEQKQIDELKAEIAQLKKAHDQR